MANQAIDSNSPQFEEKKGIKAAIWIFSVVVLGLVIVMGKLPKPDIAPAFTKALPTLNAIINTCCFLTLIGSLIMIKKKNVNMHMRLNTFAMILSVFFLLSYVLYHVTNKEVAYEGDMKIVYYTILASHIILSGVSLPFILFSYYRGFIGDVVKHRKIVKFAYPVWLYVAITGPIVYLMLSPYYS
tara:strand:- start:848 stop:1402 length:555 start_codon:yes stop_codon:yes gene_type:complete